MLKRSFIPTGVGRNTFRKAKQKNLKTSTNLSFRNNMQQVFGIPDEGTPVIHCRAVEVYQNLSFLKVPFQDQDLRTTASNVKTAIEVVSQSRSHFANFLLRTCCKSDNDTTKQSKHNANSNSAQLQFANNIAELLFAHFPPLPSLSSLPPSYRTEQKQQDINNKTSR